MTSNENLDMLYVTDNSSSACNSQQWSFDYHAEVDAIRRYHVSQAENHKFTGHHLICYRHDTRISRIEVRPFDLYQEKQNAFANMFMMVPVINPDSAILFSDVWMRSVDLQPRVDKDLLDPTNDPMSEHFVSPSKSKDRQEAITVIAMNKHGYTTQIMPYRRHDGTIFWQDDIRHVGEYISFGENTSMSSEDLEVNELISSSFLIKMMRQALTTDKPEGVSENTAYWMLENQGYSIKKY